MPRRCSTCTSSDPSSSKQLHSVPQNPRDYKGSRVFRSALKPVHRAAARSRLSSFWGGHGTDACTDARGPPSCARYRAAPMWGRPGSAHRRGHHRQRGLFPLTRRSATGCSRTGDGSVAQTRRSDLGAGGYRTAALRSEVMEGDEGRETPVQTGNACVVCWRSPTDNAHLIDRSLFPDPYGDPRRTVSLCREHHDAYDNHELDLLPYLEPGHRSELARAVEIHGLIGTLERVTGSSWRPEREETAIARDIAKVAGHA